jgi:hypothetical protein
MEVGGGATGYRRRSFLVWILPLRERRDFRPPLFVFRRRGVFRADDLDAEPGATPGTEPGVELDLSDRRIPSLTGAIAGLSVVLATPANPRKEMTIRPAHKRRRDAPKCILALGLGVGVKFDVRFNLAFDLGLELRFIRGLLRCQPFPLRRPLPFPFAACARAGG